jgi:transposase-like protein
MDETSPSALPTTPDLPSIVQRYLNGESLFVIAKESQVASRTLYRWMLAECGSQYDEVITHCLVNRIADADERLESAADSCQVARAREMAKFARMDFERRRPKLYGPKQEVQTDNTIRVIIQRDRPQPVVVQEQGQVGVRDNVSDAVQVVDK